MTIRKNLGVAAFPRNPAFSVGKLMRTVNCSITVPTTGANGDQYILAGPFSPDDRISRVLCQAFPALTSATDSNLGFYYSKDQLVTLTPVVSGGGNELWSGVTLATAVTVFTDLLMSKNSSLDRTKAIRDLLSIGSDQEPFGGIYLVLTLPTANSAGGTGNLDILVEEATTR